MIDQQLNISVTGEFLTVFLWSQDEFESYMLLNDTLLTQ